MSTTRLPIKQTKKLVDVTDEREEEEEEPSPSVSIVHVTITESGTVVYTHTATSYSYVPTYSVVYPTTSIDPNGNSNQPQNNNGNNVINPPGSDNSNGSKNALIGGIVGGVGGVGGFIALVLIAFLLVRRSYLKKKKKNLNATNDNVYATPPIKRPVHHGEELGPFYYDPNETMQGYYEDRVAAHGHYSKYHSYNLPPPSTTTNTTPRQSIVTDLISNSTENAPITGQVPNEYTRNVPHLKENEPPHSK